MRHGTLTVSGEEGDRGSLGTGATSSTDTVNIIFRVVRIVIVNHMSDVANIFNTLMLANRAIVEKQRGLGPFLSRVRLDATLSWTHFKIHYGESVSWQPSRSWSNLGMQLEQVQLRDPRLHLRAVR